MAIIILNWASCFSISVGLQNMPKLILVAKFLYVYDILILSFENNQKNIFVNIEECGKNVRFLNISENTKENLINFP